MKKIIFLLLLCSCGSYMQEKSSNTSAALHEIRIELADIKHDLHSHKVELEILEEKAIAAKDPALKEPLHALERRLTQIEKSQEKLVADLRQIVNGLQEAQKALAAHDEKLAEVVKLRSTLSSISQAMKQEASPPCKNYRVQSGDSLEKIARKHHITIEALKRENGLTKDTIFAGQELRLPDEP